MEPFAASAGSSDSSRSVAEYQKVLTEQSKQYQDFLRAETDRHQSFIQSWFGILKWVVSVGLGLFIALATWLGWKTRRDLEKEIRDRFKTRVEVLIDEKLRDFEDHVEKGKTRVEEKLSQLKSDTNRDLDMVAEYASIVSHAAVTLSLEPTEDPMEQQRHHRRRLDVTSRLLKLQEKVPTHRTLAIFVGRLFVAMDEIEKAIGALDKTIRARETKRLDKGEENQRDQAALLFNKACYLNLLARKSADPSEQERYRTEAWNVLMKCVQLCPSDREEAMIDPQLDDLGSPPQRDWDKL
jgi:hypothetical protein